MKSKYSLTLGDIEALLLSLPLIESVGSAFCSEMQAGINRVLASSAVTKLSSGNRLNENEIRISAASCELAKRCISGSLNVDIPVGVKAELSKHYFTYNKLYDVFTQLLDGLSYVSSI